MGGDRGEEQHSGSAAGPEDHWVQCDRCSKWRRVPQSVADVLDDDTAWYCEHNPKSEWASCDVPQELTNEEIDQDIQEARAGAGPDVNGHAKLPAIWQLIKSNYFSHRKRKRQDEDEIMVCHCPPPWRGGDGCGPNCINRMLCIECTQDYCPCEEHCNNQMFTRRQYAKLDVRRAGNKGFGLYAEEAIASGQFIIEYIGEVLEEEEYTRRKEYYIDVGQRHYYFMNVGNGEVIDACRKGNYGRFINHSCEPNCETQKWLVRGELAIGFFALRDISKGEELTFDYNFERYGDKPMRCYCRSKKCRQFIGGTAETSTAPLADDPEDVSNDPEPVMVREEETDAMVQTMLDKEVGTVQREWDDKLLTKLQQLCKARGIDASYISEIKLSASSTSAQTVIEAGARAAAIQAAVSVLQGAEDGDEQMADQQQEADEQEEASMVSAEPSDASQDSDNDSSPAASLAGTSSAQAKLVQQGRRREQLKPAIKAGRQRKQQVEFTAESPARTKRPMKAAAAVVRKRKLKPLETARALKAAKQEQQAALIARQGSDAEAGLGPGSLAAAAAEAAAEAAAAEAADEKAADAKAAAAPAAAPTPAFRTGVKRTSTGADAPAPWLASSTPAANLQTKRSYQQLPGLQPAPIRTFKRRSEIDRRLEGLAKRSNGRVLTQNKQTVIKVLRMFNLCDIAPRVPDSVQQQQRGGELSTAAGSRPAGDRPGMPLATRSPAQPALSGDRSSWPAVKNDDVQQAASSGGGSQQSQGAVKQKDAADKEAVSMEVGEAQQQQQQQQQQADTDTNMLEASGSKGEQPQQNGWDDDERRPSTSGAADGVEAAAAAAAAAGGAPSTSTRPLLLPLEAEAERESEARFRARQRARMADFSMLLDVVLDTSSDKLKREYISCGILNQLQQVIGRIPFSKDYSVMLVKVARVLEFLPLTPDDLYTTRTAHGTFADILRKMASTATDWEVRRRAHQLLKRYPASACKDSTLIQLHSVPAPSGRGSYLLALHLPPPQIARLLPLLPANTQQPRLGMLAREGGAHQHSSPIAAASLSGKEPHSHAGAALMGLSHSKASAGAGAYEAPQYMQDNRPLNRQAEGAWDPSAPGNPDDPELAQPLLRGDVDGRLNGGAVGTDGGGWYGANHSRYHPHRPPRAGRHAVFRPNISSRSVQQQQQQQQASGWLEQLRSSGTPYLPHHLAPMHGQHQPESPAYGPSTSGSHDDHAPPSHQQHPQQQRHHAHNGFSGADPKMLKRRPSFDGASPYPPPPHQQHSSPFSTGANGHRPFLLDAATPAAGVRSSRLSVGTAATPLVVRVSSLRDMADDDAPPATEPSAQPPWVQAPPQQQQQQQPKSAAWCYGEPAGAEELCTLGLWRLTTAGDDECADAGAPRSPLLAGTLSPVQDMAVIAAARVAGPARTPSPDLLPGSGALGVEDWMAAKRDTVLARATPGISVSRLASQELRGGSSLPPGFGLTRPSSLTANGSTQAAVSHGHTLNGAVPVSSLSSAVPVSSLTGGPPSSRWGLAADGPMVASGWHGTTQLARRSSGHGPPLHEALPNGHCDTQIPGAAQEAGAIAADAGMFDGGNLEPQQSFPEVWDEPDTNFEAFVADTVKHRLGKYVQPDHPNRISKEDAQMLYRKLRGEVVDKEREAFEERQQQSLYKPIERRKLEGNIKDFVRMSIRRMHATRAGLAT